MSFWKKITGLTLLSIPYVASLQAITSNWTGLSTTSSDWQDINNWDNGIPTNPGDIANFPNATPQQTVLMSNSFIQLSSLIFSAPSSYTIKQSFLNAIGLTFNDTQATITVSAGQLTLGPTLGTRAFVVFSNTPACAINVTDPSSILNWQSSTINSAENPSSITFTGPGQLLINNPSVNTQSQLTALGNISINSGTVTVTNLQSSPFGATNTFLISETGVISVSNATVQNSNQGAVSANSIGSEISSFGDFILTNSTLSNTNANTVTDTGVGASVSSLDFTITNGALTNSNQSAISSSGSGASITIDGNFTINNGSFTQNNSTGAQLTGSLSEGASVLVMGDASLTNTAVSFTNSVQNDSTIGAAAMVVAGNFFFNGGSFALNNSGLVTQSVGTQLQVSGDMVLNGGTLSLNNAGALTGSATSGANINIANLFTMNGGEITITNSGTSSSGLVSGSSFITTNTVLNGGTIVNDDTFGANTLTIGPGVLFAGSGRIVDENLGATAQVLSSGIVAPGDPGPGGIPGTLTINGSYTQTPSGTLVINFSNTAVSQLRVTGPATIAGTLEIAQTTGSSFSPTGTYTILQAANLQGQFSSILNFNLPPYLVPHVTYLPNSVDVFFSPVIQKYVNLTQPQFSSLNETYSRLGREMEKLRGRFSRSPASKSKVSGSQTSKSQKKQTASLYQDFIFGSTERPNAKEVAIAEEVAQNVKKEKTQRLTESLGSDRPWNFYIGPKGQVGNVISKKNTQGYKDWSVGAFSGFDYAFSEVGVGVIAEYERIKANVGKGWGDFIINNAHADTYATYAPSILPEFSVNGILGGGYEWYSIHYNIGNGQSTKGSLQGAEFDTQLGVEYAFRKNVFTTMPEKLQVSPLASIQYMYIHIDSYKERGPSFFKMNVSKQNQKSLRSTLGMRINYEWDFQDVKFSPELTMSWQREFLDKERRVHFTPTESSEFGFSRKIAKSGRNIALVGADFLVTLYDRHGLEAGYDFEYNRLYHTHFMYLSYNVRF